MPTARFTAGFLSMGLKDDWKNAGKGVVKSFSGLGKAIVKSTRVGVDALYDKTSDEEKKTGEPKDNGLKKSWSKVGHSFGTTGKALGRALVGTAKVIVHVGEKKSAEGKSDDDKNN